MAQATITLNDHAVLTRLRELAAKGHNLAPVMNRIGVIVVESVRENFKDEGRPTKWQPLSENYANGLLGKDPFLKNGVLRRSVAKKLGIRKILYSGRVGGLKDSIQYQASGNSVKIGTNKIYGAIHQFGGTVKAADIYPKNKKALAWGGCLHPVKKVHRPAFEMPARPFLMVQEEDWRKIGGEVEEWFLRL